MVFVSWKGQYPLRHGRVAQHAIDVRQRSLLSFIISAKLMSTQRPNPQVEKTLGALSLADQKFAFHARRRLPYQPSVMSVCIAALGHSSVRLLTINEYKARPKAN